MCWRCQLRLIPTDLAYLTEMFNKLLGSFVEGSFTKDAEKLLSIGRSYGPMERGTLFASVKIALAFLVLDRELEKRESIFLALDVMDSGRALSNNEMGQLSKYNLRLIDLQKQAQKSSSPINKLVSSGIPVWIISIRGLMKLPLQSYVRELWAILESGDQVTSHDLLDQVIGQLGQHPMAEQIRNSRHLTTPSLFQAR